MTQLCHSTLPKAGSGTLGNFSIFGNFTQDICSKDPEALVLLREVTTEKKGGDRVSNSDNVTIRNEPDRGNSKAYSLDRLKRD